MHLGRKVHHIGKTPTMKNQTHFAPSLDDIVFEGRNKSYGAFVLRQRADQHMTYAIMTAVLFFLLVVSSPRILAWVRGESSSLPAIEKVITVNLDPTPVVQPVKPTPPPASRATPPPMRNQIQFVPPVVVSENEETPEEANVPTTDELQNAVIGTETTEGPADGADPTLIIEASSGTEVASQTETDEPFTFVEQMPAFPGGTEAMYAFISRNMRYPAVARENNISGTVVLQFVISKEGEILQARVIRKIGGGCDEEALRVVNMMPRWKPGVHNGRNVPVTLTLPVKFVFM